MDKQKRRLTGVLFVIAVPIVILLAMLIKPLLTLSTGEEISLATKPVDPRDLMYGDYVYLEYEIEEVNEADMDKELLEKVKEKESGLLPVYAVFKKDGSINVLDKMLATKPKGSIYLKGTLNTYRDWSETPNFTADFNLDRYYVPENTGKSLEESAQEGNLIASLKIRKGYGILTALKER